MKRFIALLMVTVLVLSLAACSKKTNEDKNQTVTDNSQNDNTQTAEPTAAPTTAPTETPAADSNETSTDNADVPADTNDTADNSAETASGTYAEMVIADFTNAVSLGGATSEEILSAMFQTEYIPLDIATMPVVPGYLNGFDSEVEGFAEGTMFGPWIGAIPFIGYVFVLDEGADAQAFADTIKGKADLRWNVCTEADELKVEVIGNKVCLVMAPLSFEDEF